MFNRRGFNKIKFNQSMSINLTPKITIVSYTLSKISDETEYNKCVVVFKSDVNTTQWEARATTELQTPAQGVGLLVGDGTSVSANTDINFDVDYTELTNGDRTYQITAYAQVGGVWY